MNKTKILTTASFVALGAVLAAPTAVMAQGDTIIVSATKRAEGLQDVPVSVAAVPKSTIEKLGVVDVSDLSIYLPNFEINDSTILPNLYVRGLGSGATHSIEQSVGRFVDELYIGRGAMNLHGFFDIEAVEVLRGPQGTLFGKNTVAGAMIVRTANPTNEFEAGLNLSYGEYSTVGDYQEVQSYISG
ncbi:MAG: TonB-dependent receptor plug domain-containing protein, partial [Pseudomonadota bacterium]